MESTGTSYVLSFRMFFDPVTTGWIFVISLCENSIKNLFLKNEIIYSRLVWGIPQKGPGSAFLCRVGVEASPGKYYSC